MPTFVHRISFTNTFLKTPTNNTFLYLDLQYLVLGQTVISSQHQSQFIMNASRFEARIGRFQKNSLRSFPLVKVRW